MRRESAQSIPAESYCGEGLNTKFTQPRLGSVIASTTLVSTGQQQVLITRRGGILPPDTVSKVLFRKHLELSPYFRSDGELLEFTPATA